MKRKRGGICSGRVRNRVHRVFCLKMFIACKEKKKTQNSKEAEGENSGWDLEFRCLGRRKEGHFPRLEVDEGGGSHR